MEGLSNQEYTKGLAKKVESIVEGSSQGYHSSLIINYLRQLSSDSKHKVNPCNEIELQPLGEEQMNDTPMRGCSNTSAPINTLDKYRGKGIVTVTLVDGVDSSTLTEHQFFSKIQRVQEELKNLKLLPASTYVTKRTASLTLDLKSLVTLMDDTLTA